MRKKFLLTVFLVSALLVLSPLRASAEWFADLYVGPAFTQSKDVNLKFLGNKFTGEDVDFDTSGSFGGRLGHWFEVLPYLGFAIDVSHFRPDIGAQFVTVCSSFSCFIDPNLHFDLAVTAVSFDAMVRWPLLRSNEYPKGRLQPYLTVGPAIFIARGKDLFTTGGPVTKSDTDTSVGPKVGAGLAWQFYRNVAFFGEYRFTHFNPDLSARDVFFVNFKDEVKTQVNTHHLVLGVSVRF